MSLNGISIVIPIYNEEGNIPTLVKRIAEAFKSSGAKYEIVAVDDRSRDRSWKILKKLSRKYPIVARRKKGLQGKAYSLLQGFKLAKYPYLAMIDADLQYPPEAIPQMLEKLLSEGCDIVVADRVYQDVGLKRRIFHFGFKYFFVKILHGLDLDAQSGLKVFKSEILDKFKLSPSPWTFDLEFLLKSYYAGYLISSFKVPFSERGKGESKVRSFEAIWQIGLSAIKIRLDPWLALPKKLNNSDEGFYYKGRRYIHHTFLSHKQSALLSTTFKQKVYLILSLLAISVSFLINWHLTLIAIMAILSFLYFADLLYNFYLITRSLTQTSSIEVSDEEVKALDEAQLPRYTIFCPLYKEHRVLPQFIEGIKKLDYPKNKLQVMLLLEEDDTQTQEAAMSLNMPDYFEIKVVPDSLPRTKPKACNYGLESAGGEYVVIYDAEDLPDPQQLKKAVVAFRKTKGRIKCVQAKLNFYNPKQNVLTRLFTQEYSLWFELILTGLQTLQAPIPLGGTSNHFKTKYLKKIYGWDAFNVTEDCDLGMRIVKKGGRTAIINSTTLEEANSNLGNWFNQRTRWIKGYMQTYLVHMRSTKPFFKRQSFWDFVYFQFVVGGKVLSILINPFMWFLSILYFSSRSYFGPFIESLFPPLVFYIAVFSLVIGNFIYFYNHMIATTIRGGYELVKYAYIIPLYWLLMSAAGWVALYRLIRQPHHWSKTKHGLHLAT